jgi:hypothetical protein
MQLLKNIINDRRLFYTVVGDDLNDLKSTELANWALLVIEDNAANPVLWEFAHVCVGKDLLYMMAAGKDGSRVDDLFDEVVLDREEKGLKLPVWMVSEDDVLMTTWEEDIAEAIWFITNSAYYDDHVIDKVLIANMTKTDYLPIIEELTEKIAGGWIPD